MGRVTDLIATTKSKMKSPGSIILLVFSIPFDMPSNTIAVHIIKNKRVKIIGSDVLEIKLLKNLTLSVPKLWFVK